MVIPDKAVYEPMGPQDFSAPINYTVTAEDGTSRTYLVTVDVTLSQKEILLLIAAANPGNTLDWKETDNLNDWEEVTLDGNGNITQLILSQRSLTIVPPEIGQLGSLESLDLNNNALSSLPPEIGQLGSLRFLYLNGNALSSLPAEIGQLVGLETLDLGANTLGSLLPEIGLLTSLRFLYLNENALNSLPPEIGQLVSLEYLSLFSNSLSSLPPEIGQLVGLETLILSGNELSSLPTAIKQLVNLRELYLRFNNLSQFNHVPYIPSGGSTPSSGCPTEATNLQILKLSGNADLVALTECICDLDSDMGGSVDIDVVPNDVQCIPDGVIGN